MSASLNFFKPNRFKVYFLIFYLAAGLTLLAASAWWLSAFPLTFLFIPIIIFPFTLAVRSLSWLITYTACNPTGTCVSGFNQLAWVFVPLFILIYIYLLGCVFYALASCNTLRARISIYLIIAGLLIAGVFYYIQSLKTGLPL